MQINTNCREGFGKKKKNYTHGTKICTNEHFCVETEKVANMLTLSSKQETTMHACQGASKKKQKQKVWKEKKKFQVPEFNNKSKGILMMMMM